MGDIWVPSKNNAKSNGYVTATNRFWSAGTPGEPRAGRPHVRRVARERNANPKHSKQLQPLPAVPCNMDATRRRYMRSHNVHACPADPGKKASLVCGQRRSESADDHNTAICKKWPGRRHAFGQAEINQAQVANVDFYNAGTLRDNPPQAQRARRKAAHDNGGRRARRTPAASAAAVS